MTANQEATTVVMTPRYARKRTSFMTGTAMSSPIMLTPTSTVKKRAGTAHTMPLRKLPDSSRNTTDTPASVEYCEAVASATPTRPKAAPPMLG
jgi:hypothetical protein